MGKCAENRRLLSLDALRGLDMLFIIGLDQILRAVAGLLPGAAGEGLRLQMGHVAWEGLAVYDLIFPLFVFISGVAMYCSQARAAEKGLSRLQMAAKLWERALLLVVLGWLVNLEAKWMIGSMRYASVLGLIGLSCALAGSLALLLRTGLLRALLAGGILAAVFYVQRSGGDMTPSGCVNAAIDAMYCPGRLHLGVLDPEGPLCIVSATALCLCGMLAGEWVGLRLPRVRGAAGLVCAGAVLLAVACVCGPVIKNIWTPAFVLVSAGVGCVLLGVFHLLVDTPGGARWSLPLRIVGANALFIYLVTHALPYGTVVQKLCGWALAVLPEPLVPLGYGLCYLALAWLLCLCLWWRRIFIRI